MSKRTTRKNNGKRAASVDSIKHNDKRANIPTEELRDFVAADEAAPAVMLYPRDPSLDPQLVWKGKDQQDAADLAVPVVPIYIQEKIHPQALIDDLIRQTTESGEHQLDLFADFNGIAEFDRRVEFYQHESNWSNRMILGDSLMVMTSLAEKEGLKGKVQCMYIDPPYGIKFASNWQVSTRKRDVKDGKVEDATREPEQIRAFRDTWKLGIHSYLAYLRDRLVVARELLTETGSVFVQIGDENVHLVRCVIDEVFGSDNFCRLITFAKTSGQSDELLSSVSDYILWYAKKKEQVKFRQVYKDKDLTGEGGRYYTRVLLPDESRRSLTEAEAADPTRLPPGARVHRLDNLISQRPSQGADVREFVFNGRRFTPGKGTYKSDLRGLTNLAAANRIEARADSLSYVRFLDDFPVFAIGDNWTDTAIAGRRGDKIYVVQTAARVAERCLLMTTDPGDLVLDPTCGSGTTAYVAEQWGRRWITIDTSRVALALARTRLMAAKYPYYYLADNHPQIAQINTDEEIKTYLRESAKSVDESSADIRKGFVYKRVPHVTLKSIANNPDIREGMGRAEIDAAIARHADQEILYDQPYPDNKRVRVSGPLTVESLSPHRVLPAADDNFDGTVTEHEARKQQDFAQMILENLRKAGVQNTVKNERLKFDTLEPLAGRWLHAAGTFTEYPGGKPSAEGGAGVPPATGSVGVPPANDTGETPVPPRVRRVAVSPAKGSVGVSPAEGSVGVSPADETGETPVPPRVRRVAVSLGPEHGTVGPGQVKEAAKEAVQGVGYDVLIVCGFAFDPHVSEEAKRYGKLTVLPTKMNPDLAMGDELLKKTGAGNLFMVFGEPDVDIRRVPSEPRASATGQRPTGKPAARSAAAPGDEGELLEVEIKGVDVYDPTTGAIRSASTDDIACWFIDTNYNGESFFVRHAYFTGSDEPYQKLQRALRAEIDEAAWSSLYSTTSRPFARPETGKIAIKVINHYGDEVLKVFTL